MPAADFELKKPPITRTTLALFAGASGDHNPIHIDSDYARSIGFDDVFAHGMLGMAYASQLFTAHFPAGSLRSFDVRFLAIARVHDRLECRAELLETFRAGEEDLARYGVVARDQDGDVKLSGTAVVAIGGQAGSKAAAVTA